VRALPVSATNAGGSAFEKRLRLGLVLAGVGDERAGWVDDPPATRLVVHALDLGEHARDEQPVHARAGRG